MMLTLTYLTINQSEQCPQADHALFEPLLIKLHCSFQGGHDFEGIGPLWPPLLGEAISLFFSVSPKTLSLRFNSVLKYKGCIQFYWGLHYSNKTRSSPLRFGQTQDLMRCWPGKHPRTLPVSCSLCSSRPVDSKDNQL